MRKAQKREILEFINSLHQAHIEVKEALQQHNYDTVQNMLSECQDFAVTLGENIEKFEGEGHITVSHVEEYCETLFQVFKEITDGEVNENRIYKILKRRLLNVENSVKNDISVKMEVAFFPYKASMWDSLESVYLAAKEDPECDVYCVPIPYFDLNLDRSLGKMHYEGGEYPEDIEIIDWEKYNFEDRRPDVIYIHNPYDEYNYVVSVHPRFYSSNLKKHTDTLVYIPYYVSSGGMMEGHGWLPSYDYADYIVIQSLRFRKHFVKDIPDEKFLPFGSPKVDRVLKKCKNLPKPPEEWKEKMYDEDGRKKRVFFYNASLNDMLRDTENFFKKMEYVFKCFAERRDLCLLWRPHPLMETTLDFTRPEFRTTYEILKEKYIESGLGIYDATPDVTDAVALSDAYIGDAGSSITALFGVAGKPIFVLNKRILEDGDWRKKIGVKFDFYLQDNRFAVVQGTKLYVSEPDQYHYKYFCDLSEDAYAHQYFVMSGANGKGYACPLNAQNILVIGEKGIEKKIELKNAVDGDAVFSQLQKYDKYLLLLPINYSAVVRYDTLTGEIRYFTEHIDVFVKEKNNRKIIGGSLVYQDSLYIASPTDNMMYKLGIESGESSIIELPIRSRCGGNVAVEYRGEIWLMPYDGQVIVRWNPKTNVAREYEGFPKDFVCKNPDGDVECMEIPFFIPAFYGNYAYLPSCWANMSLKLNIDTGEFEQWIPAFEREENETKDLKSKEVFRFLYWKLEEQESGFKIYSFTRRRLYNMSPDGTIFQEIAIQVDLKEIEKNEQGFCKCYEALPYACIESKFNTLGRFLDGKTVGNPFSQEKQIEAYKDIIVNYDGGCGEKVHKFVKKIEK